MVARALKPSWILGALLAVGAVVAGRSFAFGVPLSVFHYLAAGFGLALLAPAVWPQAPALTLGRGCLLGAFAGLLIGTTEAVHQAVRMLAFDTILKLPQAFPWMVPLANVVLFTASGVLLGLLATIFRRGIDVAVAVFWFAFAGAVAHCLLYPVEWVATLVLAAGVGLQVTRLSRDHTAALAKVARRGTPVLVGVVIAGSIVGGILGRRPQTDVPPPTAAAPNVLLVVLDTVRADHLGTYGYGRETTPRIDRLAKQGVLFEQAYSAAPWTLPSHASIFTGHYPHELSTGWWSPLDRSQPTLAEVFRDRGYATAGFIGNLRFCSWEYGLDRGMDHYEDFYVRPGVVAFCSSLVRAMMMLVYGQPMHTVVRNDADAVTEHVSDWLSTVEDRPWFAFLNYYDAHALCSAPAPFGERFGKGGGNETAFNWSARKRWRPRELAGFVNAYDGALRFIDDRLGKLLDELDRRGRLENTLVIVTADHGEQFGEHNLTAHGNSLYAPLLHVPLVLSWPGKLPEGVRVTDTVSLRDLAATILDVVGPGCDDQVGDGVGAPCPLPGSSVSGLWATPPASTSRSPAVSEAGGNPSAAPWTPLAKGDMKSLVDEGMHFILNGDHKVELYDLRADPREERNLIDTAEGRAAAERMRAQLRDAVVK